MDEKGIWSRDAQHIFYLGRKVEGSDSPTFRRLAHDYWQDKNNTYHNDDVIQDADRNTFKVLSDRYATDVQHAYYEDKILPNADAGSFEVVEGGGKGYYAKDKNLKYNCQREIDKLPERLNG